MKKYRQAAPGVNPVNGRQELLCLNKDMERWVPAPAWLPGLRGQGLGSNHGSAEMEPLVTAMAGSHGLTLHLGKGIAWARQRPSGVNVPFPLCRAQSRVWRRVAGTQKGHCHSGTFPPSLSLQVLPWAPPALALYGRARWESSVTCGVCPGKGQ